MWKNMKQENNQNLGLKTLLYDEDEARCHDVISRTHLLNPLFLKLNLEMDNDGLTEQETALYDRQIRVWGIDTQRRLSKSHIFVSGLKGSVLEFCKNVVLAGIGSLTLNDDSAVTEELLSANFLISPSIVYQGKSIAEICSDSLKDFNPMVHVSVQTGDLSSFNVDFFEKFDAVVVSSCSYTTKKLVNKKCRKLPKNVAFYAVDCRGSCGEIFADLQNYTYDKKTLDDTIECQLQYPSFEEATAVPWRFLPTRICKLFLAMRVIERFEELEASNPGEISTTNLSCLLKFKKELCEAHSFNESQIPDSLLERLFAGISEFPPVSAIIGGVLAQEVIKAISGNGDPFKNFFFFDAMDGKGVIDDISETGLEG